MSASTVWRRARAYGKLLEGFQRTRMAAGYTWHAGEIHFKVRGKSVWMFGVMDAGTKLIMAHGTHGTRSGTMLPDCSRP